MARARRHRGGSVTVLYKRFLGPYPDATLHTVLVLDFVNMFLEFTGRMPTLAEASHALHMPPPRIEHHYRILRLPCPS